MNNFRRKLDDKNRLTIPAELRHEFEGGTVVLAPGFNNYLHLYSEAAWAELEEDLRGGWRPEGSRPVMLDAELADLADRFYDGQASSSLDRKQGRITIEQYLLEYAGFDRNRAVVATRMPGRNHSYWRLKVDTR
jgi:DNA-binding transcriptional regulator/RsmH inhibitor MraZ